MFIKVAQCIEVELGKMLPSSSGKCWEGKVRWGVSLLSTL